MPRTSRSGTKTNLATAIPLWRNSAEIRCDIRRDEFDREAWRQCRKSCHTVSAIAEKTTRAHGKQIAVCVHGQHPEKPMRWNVDGGVQTAGTSVGP
jgi:hypothetical protein